MPMRRSPLTRFAVAKESELRNMRIRLAIAILDRYLKVNPYRVDIPVLPSEKVLDAIAIVLDYAQRNVNREYRERRKRTR